MENYLQLIIPLPIAKQPLEESFYAEMVEMFLWNSGATGIEVRDSETFMEWGDNKKPEDGLIKLISSFNKDQNLDQLLPNLKEYIEKFIPKYNFDDIKFYKKDGKNWQVEWKKYFKPIEITENIVVKPEWENYDSSNQKIVIDINPDMAFGTGKHETTSLSTKMLEKLLTNSDIKTMLDVGTGSAILSIVAAKIDENLKIEAIDVDKKALKIAQNHIVMNKVEKNIKILNELAPDIVKRYELVVANIISSILFELKDDFDRLVEKGGYLLLSGVQKKEREDFIDKFLTDSFSIIDQTVEGEWAGFLLKKGDK